MKKIIIMVLTILCLFVVGCSKKEDTSSYEKHLGDGIIAAANEEYHKAKELFSLAKEEKSNEAEAYALYNQTNNLIEAIDSKQKKHYDIAIQLCASIEKIDSKSDIIKSAAKDLKKKCEDFKQNPSKAEKEEKKEKKEKKEKEEKKEKKEAVKEPPKEESTTAKNIKSDYKNKADKAKDLAAKENGIFKYQGELIKTLRSYNMKDVESAKAVYELSDEMLNNLYKDLKTNLDKYSFKKLKKEQNRWVEEKKAKEKGLSKDKLFMYQSLATVTINRCEKFNERYYR
ncbi:lysozyme inhibitor LprI family protein [Terrisporobacter petrolearius]|uniref:lysozyme inhibitor LprI family protein n=1 Tax=Terrisporobacter petrolearius TaxID=1460447 RepID=UPI0031CC49B2